MDVCTAGHLSALNISEPKRGDTDMCCFQAAKKLCVSCGFEFIVLACYQCK